MNFFILALFISLAYALPESGVNALKNAPSGRIIGGEVALAGHFRFMAAIYAMRADGRYFCAGTLMTELWILTAGQCVDGVTIFDIHLGSNSLTGDSPYAVRVSADTYVIHPDYDPVTLDNDLGLIELRIPVSFSDYLRPIDYLPSGDLFVDGGAVVAGWGQISDTEAGLVDDLHFANVTVLSNAECKIYYGNQITDNMVCVAGNYNEGTCVGDSGGPLVQFRWTSGHAGIAGIASFYSQNGCESTDPSGFVRLFGYNDWIRNITGKE